jgi:hypothetical protein
VNERRAHQGQLDAWERRSSLTFLVRRFCYNCSGSGAGVSPAGPGLLPGLVRPRARRAPHYLNSHVLLGKVSKESSVEVSNTV